MASGQKMVKTMAEIDKSKTCKDCPDRTVFPNCHDACEGYLERCNKRKAIAEKMKQENLFLAYKKRVVENTKRKNKKGRRK